MDIDAIEDILVANRFGRYIMDNLYTPITVTVGVGEDDTIHLYAKTKKTSEVLTQMFENEGNVEVHF